jgi:phage terminase large subunit GpA-like protein
MSLRLPTEAYHALVQSILKRDRWRCRACGYRANLAAHHVRFRSQGGEDSTQNLLILCSGCHEGLHRHSLEIKAHEGGEIDANLPVRFVRIGGWKPS